MDDFSIWLVDLFSWILDLPLVKLNILRASGVVRILQLFNFIAVIISSVQKFQCF